MTEKPYWPGVAIGLLALVIWALVGCEEDDRIPKATETITITWTIVETEREMQDLRDRYGKTSDRVRGFAVWREGFGSGPSDCHIFTHYPRANDDWETVETIRHEIGHCVAGAWHD